MALTESVSNPQTCFVLKARQFHYRPVVQPVSYHGPLEKSVRSLGPYFCLGPIDHA